MLQREHSAILLTFIKLPFVIKIFVLSIVVLLRFYCISIYYSNSFIDKIYTRFSFLD